MGYMVNGSSYESDERGLLLKIKGKGYLKHHLDKDGYLRYAIFSRKTTYNLRVHRVVWEIFNGKIPEGMTVDHIDGNKLNNNIENLQLLSPMENARKSNSKEWTVISPTGEQSIIVNLKGFCKQNSLHPSHIVNTHSKGWKAYVRN